MKCIIAGSRSFKNHDLIDDAVDASKFSISEVVSGGARGVDKMGEEWALDTGRGLKIFPANWDKFGKSAGYRRNVEMAEYADALIAIWDGESKGTEHMINLAYQRELKVFVYRPEAVNK